MTDSLWIWLLGPFVGGLALSFALECVLRPRPVPVWRRPLAAIAVHIGIFMVVYGLEVALFRRPVFAMVNVLALQAIIVLVSNAKFDALREPFVYPDFEYFLDAMRHPRLYLPFFGRLKAALAAGGYGAALVAGLTIEESLTGGAGLWALSFTEWFEEMPLSPGAIYGMFWVCVLLWVACGALLTWWASRTSESLHVAFDAGADLRRLGLYTSLVRYCQAERAAVEVTSPFSKENRSGESPAESLRLTSLSSAERPDIVVIQSESFFDARRSFPTIRNDVLKHFDWLKASSHESGTLHVAAWGANTVRTEFAFLSGIRPDDLGIHKYNPYRRLARQGFNTLASHLRSKGYRTVCVHPYPASFYTREKVYPKMGFDAFIDIQSFAGAERFGPYVSDAAVADKVRQILGHDRSAQPLFVFVITMENHGPLHWETVGPADKQKYFTDPPDADCNDLVAYTRHLANADGMFRSVAEMLQCHTRASVLCIYGDHVPIMPKVYHRMGEPPGSTDFLIWRPEGQGTMHRGAEQAERHVSELAQAVLRCAETPAVIR